MADKHLSVKLKTYFSAAANRLPLNSGEEIQTTIAKIAKWLGDLKTVAFTGSYNDLSDKPTIDNTLVYIKCMTENFNTAKSLLQAGKAVITAYNDYTFPLSYNSSKKALYSMALTGPGSSGKVLISILTWTSSSRHIDSYYITII